MTFEGVARICGLERFFQLLLVPCLCCLGCAVFAGDSPRQMVADSLRASVTDLSADRFPSLEVAEQQFLASLQDLDDYLRRRSSPANREAWLTYLDLKDLEETVAAGAGDLPQQTKLAEALQLRLQRNFDGLNLPPFVSLRGASNRLVVASQFERRQALLSRWEGFLRSVAERVESRTEPFSAEEAANVNSLLKDLHQAEQLTSQAATLRQLYGHSNLRVCIGEGLLQQVAGRPVNRQQDVHECILGTRIRGRATISGDVRTMILPSTGTVRVALLFNADLRGRNVGTNRGVRLDTVVNGSLAVNRVMRLNERGISLDPAQADVRLNSSIVGVSHRSALVRKIAAKRAAQQRPLAERLSQNRTQQRLVREFQQQTAELEHARFGAFIGDAEKVLKRLDVAMPSRNLHASGQTIFLDVKQAESWQILAGTHPPPFSANRFVTVQLHESCVNNVALQVLAGRTMKQQQINSLYNSLRPQSDGELPEPFVAPIDTAIDGGTTTGERDHDVDTDELDEPFEIDFHPRRPLIFESSEGQLRLGIRGRRFQQGSKGIREEMEITATYQPVVYQDKVYLKRQGGLQVSFPRKGSLGIREVAIKTNIQNAFVDIFPDALLNRPIELPFERIGGLTVYPREIKVVDGWISIALQ